MVRVSAKTLAKFALAFALTGCVADEGAAPSHGDPETLAFPHCGPAPIAPSDSSWTIGVDGAGTPGPSDDVVILDPAEYAKVGTFRDAALAWMECTLREYREIAPPN